MPSRLRPLRLEDLWQLHRSPAAADDNSAEQLIANPESACQGKGVKVTAKTDGSFAVTNERDGFSKTYQPK